MTDEKPPERPTKWDKTVLWQTLAKCEKHDAQKVVAVLNSWMPRIEQILSSGGTSPKDFTLHDDQHAARVAHRMAEIIPKDTLSGLSPYELAFLLLSAYLHDIGMTPEYRKVSQIYQYLLTAERGSLVDYEIQELQRWLDDDQDGVTPPLCSEKPTLDDLSRASRLVAHYCRHRHNDWSAEWIRNNAPMTSDSTCVSLGTFTDWVDELVRLCQSHHCGRSQLESSEFDPRPVGQPGQVLHLRYLACVLRVADVLEFDPERTPDVILSHRDVEPGSLIYWHKDHAISAVLEGNRLVLAARPSSARLYRAIEETLDQIDFELLLCRTLADDTHFENCPGISEKQPHKWNLLAAVHRDLKPKPDAFVYIDSSFRPNTQKILQLFSGIELYGNPLVAVRELLQNSFDAVREQIAHERLRSSDPSSRAHEESLGKQHRVELRLEQRADGYSLVCSDTGVGMTKQIIENYLLVSGQSRRHDIAALERRCQDAGFTTGRTGQFGIGVLSYFMIADRIALATRRSLEPGDADPTGWVFETEGVGSWGELRRANLSDRGTRVELHLKREMIDDAAVWYRSVAEYLRNSLAFIPCQFHFNSALAACEPLTINPGWIRGESHFATLILENMRGEASHKKEIARHLLPSDDRVQLEERDRRWEQVRDKARDCLQWATREGDLPDGLGRYRLHFPYFELPGGASLLFMDVDERKGKRYLHRIGEGCSYGPSCPVKFSWKGIAVAIRTETPFVQRSLSFEHYSVHRSDSRTCIEIEFRADAAGKPEVNRSALILSKSGSDSIKYVRAKAKDLIREFVTNNLGSSYAVLNARYGRIEGLPISKPEWLLDCDPDSTHAAIWERVLFPVVDNVSWSYQPLPKKATWKGKEVRILRCVGGPSEDDHYEGIHWANLKYFHPDRVIAIPSYRRFVGVMWERNPLGVPGSASALVTSKFPPFWKQMVGVAIEYLPKVWNRSHRVARAISPEALNWVRAARESTNDPLAFRDELLCDRAKAAAWLIQMLVRQEVTVWRGLIERDPNFLRDLWTVLFGKPRSSKKPTILAYYVQQVGVRREGLHVVDPGAWRTLPEQSSEFETFMPDPGPDWTIEIEHEAARKWPIDAKRETRSKSSKKKQSRTSPAKKTKKPRRKKR